VGERLAEHTLPLKNSNKILTVLTDHPVYSQQLSFLSETLRQRIEEAFPPLKGQIKRITFQVNAPFFKEQFKLKSDLIERNKTRDARAPHPFSPVYKALTKEADHVFSDIDDGDLKLALTSLYVQSKSDQKD
jgi:hypothetical protein